MLGRMLLYAMVMIVAFGLGFSGVMMLVVEGTGPPPVFALSFAIGGPLLGAICLWRIVVLNRAFQADAHAAALADPSSVYARWTEASGREVMLAKSGLFLDQDYYAFDEPYSELEGLGVEGEELVVRVSVRAGSRRVTQTQRVALPEAQRAEVDAAIAELRASIS